MHPHLEMILEKGKVKTADGNSIPLTSNVSSAEGLFMQRIIEEIKPSASLEIGLAFGISAMWICEALKKVGAGVHYILDPMQNDETQWQGIGLANLKACGYEDVIKFIEERSEYGLPKLAAQGIKIDFALIDGWHTFDHCLLDFFYINRMLNVGGVIVFDDANYPGISRVLDYIKNYPCYRPYAPNKVVTQSILTGLKRGLKKNIKQLGVRLNNKYPYVALQKVSADERGWDWYERF